MAVFNVTYEIVTQESAEHGDSDESGFIIQGAGLRDALFHINRTRTAMVGGVEAIETSESGSDFRWITVYNAAEYETGAHESRSLHIPDNVTPSSRRRIARMLGARV